ncbi:MAG: phospholipid/cholesterol/gamma-HCH transport system substrate-binding protein [Baekduia sp.]|jgi:phospholipid/cholesterol/gamma-HCH transport system substrate-binding protein|nr:phospholipid/cholesterol/gamma-HCH transport system substrate-binding protein [Baekduia sp.]
MRAAIRKYRWDFLAVVGIFLISLVVGGYILGHQRFYLPKWVPFVGTEFVSYKAEFATAQSVTPGQGQSVNVAGVPIGELASVELKNGRAVVTMKIRRKYAHVYKDATALLRPKTGLNDMIVELTPGHKSAGELDHAKQVIPITQTLPNVNTDEFLAALDGDTRDYLKLLVAGGGEALGGNGKNLSAAFRRFQPTNRDILKITQSLAARRDNIARSVHNFKELMAAVGSKDQQLADLVDASNAVFKSFAKQDAQLRQTLTLLPDTLKVTDTAVQKAGKLGAVLGPTLNKLQPGAKALGPSLKQVRPFMKTTTPVLQKQLRPFARDALPTVKVLRPAARDLAALTPDFTSVLKTANYLLNTAAYNPPGSDEGYLFWISWLNHIGPTVFSTQDAHGPIRRGALFFSCSGLTLLDNVKRVNPQLGTIIGLTNVVTKSDACAQTAQAPGTNTPVATPAKAGG